MNRVIWDFNNAAGYMVPPGSYKVRMSAAGKGDIQPLTLTMDPRLVADHVTAADLKEQYDHNNRMHDMVNETTRLASRIRAARTKDPNSAAIRELATTMFGVGEGIRYGQPGLQQQVTYLAGMTARVDQRIGQDAIDRAKVLRKDLDALEARASAVLGTTP
jgi:hypothetical protein